MPRTVTLKDYEQWKSNIDGEIWIKQYDRRGDEISVRVQGGKVFNILPEERRLTQEFCAETHLDPFQNGHLVPVKLVESADDFEDLKGNPNHITEDDMRGLLADSKNVEALAEGISHVKNPTTLVRLLAIAEDPDEDCTVRQVATIRDRLQEVQQQTDYEEIETMEVGVGVTSDGRDYFMTKAPKSSAPRNVSAGRRETRI